MIGSNFTFVIKIFFFKSRCYKNCIFAPFCGCKFKITANKQNFLTDEISKS